MINILTIISTFALISCFYCFDPLASYESSEYTLPTLPVKTGPTYVLARTTEIQNVENYDKCVSTGKLNVVSIGRDELFFLNMSCFNYYSSNPLARESFGLVFGDQPTVLTPIVNFTISNVVRGGLHYEIHEGFVADGDLINATVSKVKVFNEADFQKGCAAEPGLKNIRLVKAEISFKAPYGDYEITCQGVQNPGLNNYSPGIVHPEVLASQIKYT